MNRANGANEESAASEKSGANSMNGANSDGSAAPFLTPLTRLRRKEGIAWRLIDGEAVLVNVRRDDVMHLNPVASLLWSSLDGKASLEGIACSIAEEYDVSVEQALADAIDFAGSLLEQEVVEIVELE